MYLEKVGEKKKMKIRKKLTKIISFLLTIIFIAQSVCPSVINASENDERIQYSLFASNKISFNTDSTIINGNVYSDGDVSNKGKNSVNVNGIINCKNNIGEDIFGQKQEYHQEDSINYLDRMDQIYFSVESINKLVYSNEKLDISKNISTLGDLEFVHTTLTGTGYINAVGSIIYKPLSKEQDFRAFMCSKEENIYINGDNVAYSGVIYAPNGTVTVNCKSFTLNGVIIAQNIIFNGTTVNINYSDVNDLLEMKPTLDININGSLKENRKVTLDISSNLFCTTVTDVTYNWSIYPVNDGVVQYDRASDNVCIDEESSTEFTKNLLFKEKGEYLVRVNVQRGKYNYYFDKKIVIEEDLAPVANFVVTATCRDSVDGFASIYIEDLSYSRDNDEIKQRIWTISYDQNNNGDFSDDENIIISNQNETEVIYKTQNVGSYKIELEIVEGYTDTMENLLTDEDYKRADTLLHDESIKTTIVNNICPEAVVDVQREKIVDIVLTTNGTNLDKITTYSNKINEVKERLESQGFTVRVNSNEVSTLTAKDSFDWEVYDHNNYSEAYFKTLEKHILLVDNSIKMLGYSEDPNVDFLYINSDVEGQKEFTFDMQKDSADWHSLVGGGFLFNSSIEDGKISGYLVILQSNGYFLYCLDKVELEDMRNNSYLAMTNQIAYVATDSSKENHNIKIIVDKYSISMWDNELLVFDNFLLTTNQSGNGFGPILLNASHACSQCSFFTFNNIKMSTVDGVTLSKAVEDYEWLAGAQRYVVNLSDSSIYDLNSSEKIAETAQRLISNNIKFISLGNTNNEEQSKELIKSVEGTFIYNGDASVYNDIYSFLVNDANKNISPIDKYISTEDVITYRNYYSDYEKDPMYESQWDYAYNKDAIETGNINEELSEKFVLTEPINQFSKAGSYKIKLKVRDNPVGDNDNFDEYRKWSKDNSDAKVLWVNNKPVASLTFELYEKTGTKDTCYVKVDNDCYDIDHINDNDKGVVEYNYQWKKVSEEKWNDGLIPEEIETNEVFLQKLIVKDKEGFYSNPAVAIISTIDYKNKIVNPPYVDITKPEVSLTLSNDYPECGDTILINGYAKDDSDLATTCIYINDELVTEDIGSYIYIVNQAGDLKIKIYAKDIYGNENYVEKIITVSDNKDKEVPLISIVDNVLDEVNDRIFFMGSVTDNVEIKKYYISYKLDSDENYTTFYEGDTRIVSSTIGSLDTKGLETGTYDVKIEAWDTSDNKSIYYTNFAFTKKTIVDDDLIPPEIILDLNSDKIKIGEENTLTVTVKDNKKVEKIQVYKDDKLIMESQGIITFSEAETGCVHFKVVAIDESGNKSIKEIECTIYDEVIYDKTGPTIIIDSPITDSKIGGMVTIIGSVYDETKFSQYEIAYKPKEKTEYMPLIVSQGEIISEALGTFDTLNWEDGIYDFRIIATDQAGNSTSSYIQYIVDNSNENEKKVSTLSMNLSGNKAEVGQTICVTPSQTNITDLKVEVDGVEYELDNNCVQITSDTAKVSKVVVSGINVDGNLMECEEEIIFYDPSDLTAPKVEIVQNGNVINKSTDIVGTVTDDVELKKYKLEYAPKGEDNYSLITESDVEKENEILGTLDTTAIPNGIYDIKLTAIDKGGNKTVKTISYTVEGNLKIGNMSLYFEDINSQFSGLNVSVIRRYNSNVKCKGDFGYGWSLEYNGLKIYETGVLGKGFSQSVGGYGFSTYYQIQESTYHDIVVSYGDGTSDRFQPVVSPNRQAFVPIQYVSFSYVCVTNPNRKLDIVDLSDSLIISGFNDMEIYDMNMDIYDPQQYQLTMEDGTKIIIDKTSGIRSISDGNGNTVNVSSDGYICSDGKSISFDRDEQGRITKATDTFGDTITYEYDSRGDLVSVTNKSGSTIKYTYDNNHNLSGIIDPTGAAVARNEYDQEGRLIATIDANGNRTEFSHDIDGRQEVMRDKNGNATVYIYDEQGNILSKVDPYGNTVNKSYDNNNNIIKYTDELGNNNYYSYDTRNNLIKVTNPLNNSCSYEYNTLGQITSETDFNGNISSRTYDNSGNMLTETTKLGDTITYTYDAKGNILSEQNANNDKVVYTYNESNNLETYTDIKGNISIYTYNEKNQLIKELVTNPYNTEYQLINYEYDLSGNITRQYDNAGNDIKKSYDYRGNIISEEDKYGNKILSEYDLNGNKIKVSYSDGTYERFTYDSNNNMLSKEDRNGYTTTYVYGKNNEQLEINYENGAKESYEYDEKGQVIKYINKLGNIETYVYDANGNKIEVTNSLTGTVKYSYDKSGNMISMEDSYGNVTQYIYDECGNKIKMIYPDGTDIEYEYDSMCNCISEKDREEKATSYTYDSEGKVLSVTDSMNNTTKYSYDSRGKLVSQTDANGNESKYVYDISGNLKESILPSGDIKSNCYNNLGQLISSVDYEGNKISYEYMDNGKLYKKVFPDGSQIEYEYYTNGNLKSITQGDYCEKYIWNKENKLISKTDSDGNYLVYTYDYMGNVTSITSKVGTLFYGYDNLGRQTCVSDYDGKTTTYSYDNNGNITLEELPNGYITEYTYNNNNELIYEQTIGDSGNIIFSSKYTLGTNGERTKVVESTGRIIDYKYDDMYRLIYEKYTMHNEEEKVIAYTYDSVGNRTGKDDNGDIVAYSYDENNCMISENDIKYTYDKNGNLLSKEDNNEQVDYVYNYNNKLESVSLSKTKIADYSYDVQGNRIKQTDYLNSITTNYLWDTNREIAQVVYENESNTTQNDGSIDASYVFGDYLINQERDDTKQYYICDGQ